MVELIGGVDANFQSGGAAESEIVRDVKDNLCDIAWDVDTEMKETTESSDKETNYELPDGISLLSAASASVAPRCFSNPASSEKASRSMTPPSNPS